MHILAILLLAQNCFAGEKSLIQQAETVLKNASAYFHSISTQGGYVGMYSVDLKKRYGEALYEEAKATEIWVQPPGTPSVGECFLRAYRITGEKQYLTAATDAARVLAWGQRTAGGWDHRVDVAHLETKSKKAIRKDGRCTFNDNAINDCIKLMLRAHGIYGKNEYLQTAKRGGDFIILSQLPPPQSGWAQQYSHDLKPAWARSFEPPGVCSAATIRNIRTLVDLYLYTNEGRYLEPIPLAFEWLDNSKIGETIWARLYEEGTNKPVYGDREDGYKLHYVYENISEFERTSYSWQGQYGFNAVTAYYNDVKSLGADSYIAKRDKELTADERKRNAELLEPEIKTILSGIDDKGRWINNDMITCKDFVINVNMLCEYLELSRHKQ